MLSKCLETRNVDFYLRFQSPDKNPPRYLFCIQILFNQDIFERINIF